MGRKVYNLGKLSEKDLLDTSVTTWFFYNYDEYCNKLTEFVETYPQYLRNYNPTVVVVSEEEKKVFIQDCASVRALLTQLGMNFALNELNNMENAVLAGEIKELDDGLTKFHAALEIYAKHIAAAEETSAVAKPEIIAVANDEKKLHGLTSLLEEKYTITILSSGAEVIAALQSHEPPDMFFISVKMNEINGYELALIIREQLNIISTPLFFLTESNTQDPVRELLPHLENHYIQLPITDKKLLLQIIEKGLTSDDRT